MQADLSFVSAQAASITSVILLLT